MELRQVAYVLAVADHGTFTRAAASIPVSQPALSQGIATLERDLGVALFDRVGRSVQLSPAGQAFVTEARQLTAHVDRVRNAVSRVAQLETGHLDLVALPTLAVTPLVDLISRFRSRYPGVTLRVREHEGTADDALGLILDGTCEIGLVELPAHDLHPGLVRHPLGDQEYFAVCPPGTPTRSSARITLDELAGLPLVTTPPGTSSRRVLEDAFTAAGLPVPTPAVETWHRELLGPLVRSGRAATILPGPLAARAESEGAVVAPLEPSVIRSIGLVHRTGPSSPAAEAFLAAADETRQDTGGTSSNSPIPCGRLVR